MDMKRIGLVCLVLLVNLPPPADAASFVLNDGMYFEGEVIQGTGNSIIIKSESGSLIPLAYNKIATVSLLVDGNRAIEGSLLSWENGVYILRAGERIIGVQDGSIISATGPAEDPDEPVILDSGANNDATDVAPAVPSSPAPITQPTM